MGENNKHNLSIKGDGKILKKSQSIFLKKRILKN